MNIRMFTTKLKSQQVVIKIGDGFQFFETIIHCLISYTKSIGHYCAPLQS